MPRIEVLQRKPAVLVRIRVAHRAILLYQRILLRDRQGGGLSVSCGDCAQRRRQRYGTNDRFHPGTSIQDRRSRRRVSSLNVP
jgi:hypothetical protein